VRTIEYLSDPIMRGLFLPGIVTGVAIAVVCACLAVFVVLKRFSFIGQGVSHAAFGGMGVAAVLGLTGASLTAAQAMGQFSIILSFCLAAAMIVAWMSARRGTSPDTAIGIVLVASMTLGAILMHAAFKRQGTQGPGWESVLFGAILSVGWSDAIVAASVSLAVLAVLWWERRKLIFWAFDESTAPAFGVPPRSPRIVLMVLLCLSIVTAMKLAGVVLATAVLVLPGATALALSKWLTRVFAISVGASLVSLVIGLVVSMELDWPPGASIVGAMTLLYALSRLVSLARESGGSGARVDA
jgi:zinc transport system permease protein